VRPRAGWRCFERLRLPSPWAGIYWDEVVCHGEPELAYQEPPDFGELGIEHSDVSAEEFGAWLNDPALSGSPPKFHDDPDNLSAPCEVASKVH
jgi:hypothetical protein